MTHWPNELLHTMSLVADPPADDAIRVVFEQHGIERVNALMSHLVRNDDLIPTALPEVVQDYLRQTASLPTWANPDLLDEGLRIFNLNGPEVVMMLFGASLPIVYTDPMIARVLVLTTNLTKNTFRRIIETAQFVIDVTAPDAFAADGHGIRTVQKVRLMHAAIRYLITHDQRWQADWSGVEGVPISQMHLIGTLFSFSTTIIDGLDLLNIHLTDAERKAFMHLWRVIGYLLGIQESLLPDSYADSVLLLQQWRTYFQRETSDGQQLMRALLTLIDGYLNDPITKGLIIDWIRIWIGDDAAQLLHVPPANWTRVFVPIERWAFGLMHRTEYKSQWLAYLARGLSRKLLIGAVDYERGGNRPMFRVSDSLQEAVGMAPLKRKIALRKQQSTSPRPLSTQDRGESQ